MIIADSIGYLGMIVLLIAYCIATFGRLKVSNPIYLFLSAISGCCLTFNAWYHGAWPLVYLNFIFVIISAIGLWVNRNEEC